MVNLVTRSISDVSKSFTISAGTSLGWGWIRGPGTKLSCPTAVWPCQERFLPNVLGASPALLPPVLPQLPSTGLQARWPQQRWGPRWPSCDRTQQVQVGVSPRSGWGHSHSCGLSSPIHHNSFCLQFSSTVILKHFSKAGCLSHNQRSELQTKFLAGLCFILSYFPSVSLSFILAQSIIFLTDHTWYIIYFHWITPLDKAWWSKYRRETQKTSGICFSFQPIHHFKMYCRLNW